MFIICPDVELVWVSAVFSWWQACCLFLEYSRTPGNSPWVLPGGLLHFLQDPRDQDRWCCSGSALSRSAGHVGVHEVESELRWNFLFQLLQSRQEDSVGCCHQWVPLWLWLHVCVCVCVYVTYMYTYENLTMCLDWSGHPFLKPPFSPMSSFPLLFGQCVTLWWSWLRPS